MGWLTMQSNVVFLNDGVPGAPTSLARQRESVAAAVPDRIERVLAALTKPGSIAVLMGEPGTGQLAIAEQAARFLVDELGAPTETITLPHPPHATSGITSVFSSDFPDAVDGEGGASERAQRILLALVAQAEGRAAVLVAPGIDGYSPSDMRVLELLADDTSLRMIGTARQLSGGVERLSHGKNRIRIPIAPFDGPEADAYLSALLGVEQIEAETLRRWQEATGGNSYALAVLAFAADRSGTLKRGRGVAWVAGEADEVPTEYARLLVRMCSPEEVAALELVALAEPVMETVLLRNIDAASLSTLFERGLVVSRHRGDGASLVVGHPLLAASLRAGMSPVRRIQLNDQVFRILADDLGTLDPVYAPERLLRLVVFGIEGGHNLPLPWLWAAFELLMQGGDPRLLLNLALAVTSHGEASAMQAGTAALRACRTARLLGDNASLRPVLGMIRGLLDDPARQGATTPMLRVRLTAALIEQSIWDDGSVDDACAALDSLEESVTGEEAPVVEAVRAARVLVLAYSGRLREAASASPEPEISTDLKAEWVRSPARAVHALILDQQGAMSRALASVESTRMLSRLGPRARTDFIDLQGFCWLLGYWVSGSTEAARQVLEELVAEASADTRAEAHYSGLVEAGTVLLAVQEGRWADTAQNAERLVDRLSRHDAYGLVTLVQSALALALAVLGERDGAMRAIRASEAPDRGISLALGGHRALLSLRARQWLGGAEALPDAERISEWARDEELALIELQALHAIAFEARAVRAGALERARELAATIDPPVGGAFVAHMERIAAGPGAGAGDTDEPEVRMLAGFGIWLPLPPAPGLTAREREVALLAALGHSSRFISERLHISVRTVETHLSNVFAKTGVENRDELWRWAARNRMGVRPGAAA